jgi:hypothetical protein
MFYIKYLSCMIFCNKFRNIFLFLVAISFVTQNWNMDNVSAIGMYDDNVFVVIDKENSFIKNSKHIIEYYMDWINNLKRSNEFLI